MLFKGYYVGWMRGVLIHRQNVLSPFCLGAKWRDETPVLSKKDTTLSSTVVFHLDLSLYSLIETLSCLKLIYGPQQHGIMFVLSYLNHLDMSLIGFLIWTPASKYLHLTTFSKICVILSMFLYCNCLKMPKKSQINEYSDISLGVFEGFHPFKLLNAKTPLLNFLHLRICRP